MIALDLYLAYLRAAFNTCYYCAVVTDHLEELQRKCIKHIRKPLSKMLLQEVQAAEASKVDKDVKDEEGADAVKEKDVSPKDKAENRDWKRNGRLSVKSHILAADICMETNAGLSGSTLRLRCSSIATAWTLGIMAGRATKSMLHWQLVLVTAYSRFFQGVVASLRDVHQAGGRGQIPV